MRSLAPLRRGREPCAIFERRTTTQMPKATIVAQRMNRPMNRMSEICATRRTSDAILTLHCPHKRVRRLVLPPRQGSRVDFRGDRHVRVAQAPVQHHHILLPLQDRRCGTLRGLTNSADSHVSSISSVPYFVRRCVAQSSHLFATIRQVHQNPSNRSRSQGVRIVEGPGHTDQPTHQRLPGCGASCGGVRPWAL